MEQTVKPADTFDVFLSHNSCDKPAVRQLARQLKELGLTVWLDEEQLVPGRPWQSALEDVVRTAKSTAVLVGKDGIGPWQNVEMRSCLSEFVDRQLPVIPVLLPGTPSKPELPMFLRAFTWVDLRDGFKREGLERLKWGITSVDPPSGAAVQYNSPWYRRAARQVRHWYLKILALVFVATIFLYLFGYIGPAKRARIPFDEFLANFEQVAAKDEASAAQFKVDYEDAVFKNWKCLIEEAKPATESYWLWKDPIRADPEQGFVRIRAGCRAAGVYDSKLMKGSKVLVDGKISTVDFAGGTVYLQISRISRQPESDNQSAQ